MYLRRPTVGNSLFKIFLLSLFAVEQLHTSSLQLDCLFLLSSTLSKCYHGKYVGSIDKDLVDFLHTERCGFGVEEVDRWNDTSGDNCPDQVELPAEGLESERSANYASA